MTTRRGDTSSAGAPGRSRRTPMATNPSEGHRVRSYDSDCLRDLIAQERAAYVEANPRSQELAVQARRTLLAGVPMSWMAMLVGAFPLYFTKARGNRIVDVDGHSYIDFCLGDTGAMTGHSPEVVTDAIDARLRDEGRHHHDAADGGRRRRGRRPAAPLRPSLLAVHAVGDRRQPLRAAHGAPDPEAALRARLLALLPRHGRRDDRRHRTRRRRRWPSRATSARRSTRRRPPRSSSSTTSRPCARRSRRATSPSCSWSRR